MLFRSIVAPIVACSLLAACGGGAPPTPTGPDHDPVPNGLLLSLAVLENGPNGPVPQPARLGILADRGNGWTWSQIEDPDSNVFHKAMVYPGNPPAILTAGGSKAELKLWRPGAAPELLWQKDFGGKFSRMRDIEVADLDGDGDPDIAVATHDQGVVAVLYATPDGFEVSELDQQPNTFVHEIEIGDLDHDGVPEVYATPSLPNKLDGTPQPGSVVRYVPAAKRGREVVADLGNQHAKEILVDDLDGDGVDELYVSVEAVDQGQVQIKRFDADTPPDGGAVIATLPDKLTRFLTAGDVDGDGVKEMVAAANKSGLWLLRPGDDPHGEWIKTSIDRNSGGFEHASILTDLDGDGIDELYVANDDAHQVNRYVWQDGQPVKTTLYTHPEGLTGFTWNIMPAPLALLPTE